jgi:alkylation response protein AidB-like acyl-CoA dehydrogenase
MALTTKDVEEQKKQVEEMLFSGPQKLGFAKGIFFGRFNAGLLFPYPEVKAEERAALDQATTELRRFVDTELDPAAIDRNSEIPQSVIDGLGRIGVLGATAPKEYGGPGFSQYANTKLLEIIGSRCAATGVFVNAHHSIGIRALLMFGTEEQKKRWLPPLVSGKQLGAFALTEPQAGSDAANVQTMATPSPDGKTYILNGEKRYITNGGIAQMLTVMARTPVPGTTETKVTAFIVTPDMPGFKVLNKRMDKCGIRGTQTGKLAFENMPVPAENILGELGRGLKIALHVLDFGRTTFGAMCTGVAKFCVAAAIRHANSRKQFKQTIGEFELVKKKIAYMAAHAFAMEATTSQCAAFIDRDIADYMLETAMLKVWSTDALWQVVYDTMQIYGGQGYFTDEPYERLMRDARLNTIGEGANDVLRAFIAGVGMREVGESLKGVQEALHAPFKNIGTLWKFGRKQVVSRFTTPEIPVQHASLQPEARALAKQVRDFGLSIESTLMSLRKKALQNKPAGETVTEETLIIKELLKSQLIEERLSDASCELYAASCTLSRLDHLLQTGNGDPEQLNRDEAAGRYYMKLSSRRFRQCLAGLDDNDDEATVAAADTALGAH